MAADEQIGERPNSARDAGAKTAADTPVGEERSPLVGIGLKLVSVATFVGMSTCIKAAGEGIATGQIVFFRSAFAMVPILLFLALRRQLRTAFSSSNKAGHFWRGLVGVVSMGAGFYGLTKLPLPETIALGYAMPILTVIFAALFLGETVRLYRWSAVIVGLAGVLIMCWPRLTVLRSGALGAEETLGALAVLFSATLGACAMILVRRLIRTETTSTIVLYFSLSATVFSLLSIPFGWEMPRPQAAGLLIAAGFLGGLGQILLTESYRYAGASTIAPFEYVSIILGTVIGYVIFSEVPTPQVLAGTVIVVGSGLFIIFREHALGFKRGRSKKLVPMQG